MYNTVKSFLTDTKFQGGKQKNILPAALVNIVSKIAVKRHSLNLYRKFTLNNYTNLDENWINSRHPSLPG